MNTGDHARMLMCSQQVRGGGPNQDEGDLERLREATDPVGWRRMQHRPRYMLIRIGRAFGYADESTGRAAASLTGS